ncbi:18845_t:CDS:2 [Entrophospora sp. SA101]|nr:18845_t:CDS:2 [Entrophospora sp. SA101]
MFYQSLSQENLCKRLKLAKVRKLEAEAEKAEIDTRRAKVLAELYIRKAVAEAEKAETEARRAKVLAELDIREAMAKVTKAETELGKPNAAKF